MKFLSVEWFDKVNDELQNDQQLAAAAENANVGVQQVITGAPEGEIRHYLEVRQGKAAMALGEIPNPDATMTATYEDAKALNEGSLDMMGAFMSGKLIVTGNIPVLMQNQVAMNLANEAVARVRPETEYA